MANKVQRTFFKMSVLCTAFLGVHSVNAQSKLIENSQLIQLINEKRSLAELNLDAKESKDSLWQKYVHDAQSLTKLKAEHDAHSLEYSDKVMRFFMEKKGDAAEGGRALYIALHGGGGAPSYVNEGQWEAMKYYYNDSVDQGIYVATRGITDNWKLHWEDESYPLYDKLIESMVLFEGVDPNKVYFLGFSAGGDGVYQVVPRMADRFAAANMSAGHHNWVTFDNLYNTPFLIQVGELDSAYKRNQVSAENYLALNALHEKYGGGYIHDLFLHLNGTHNYPWRDNDSARGSYKVITDAQAWLDDPSTNRETKEVNSNAIDWLKSYTRNPYPQKIVWDLSVGAPTRTISAGSELLLAQGASFKNGEKLAEPHELFYWLDVSVADHFPEKGKLVVEANKSENTINVVEVSNVDKFRVLLSSELVNLSNPIEVQVGGVRVGVVHAKPNLKTMTRTLLERSDKNFIFEAEVTLQLNKETQAWSVVDEV